MPKYLKTISSLMLVSGSAFLLASCSLNMQGEPEKAQMKLVSKATSSLPERRGMKKSQPREGFVELPFVEPNPAPAPRGIEKDMGFMLFQRPIMDMVYPNSNPLPEERISTLSGFATQGEFEPVSFSLYPFEKLKNLRVRVSSLKNEDGEISKENIDAWLLTYDNVRYPRYTSKTWRRMPELLENVTVHTAPAKECQRYWLRVKVPASAKGGIYRGNVLISHDGFDKALSIPIKFRVLPFKLLKDPKKHYSAYNYNMDKEIDDRTGRLGRKAKEYGKEWILKAARNEYNAMVDYGLDTAPTIYLKYDQKKKEFYIPNGDVQIKEILAAGMKGPIPLAGCGMGAIYRQHTGKKQGRHSMIPVMPPKALYEQLTKMTIKFEKKRKAKGWPEFIYVPLDEVAASSRDFGVNVYKAFKKAGVKTYATKNPKSSDSAYYAPYVDFWCCQPYSTPYEEVVKSKKHEYWSYPNHNLNENRRTGVRCKGGRMTYGFGYWRSGFTMLIPWIWRSYDTDHFSKYAACGNQFDKDGNMMPAVYWECFREGADDAKYIYTLQTAIVQREGSSNLACKAAVKNGKELLQQIWDSIEVQEKYLNKNMWPSEEFNAIRWRMAVAIMDLQKYPAVNKKTSPSVIVDWEKAGKKESLESFFKEQKKNGNLEVKSIGDDDFSKWKPVGREVQKSIEAKHKKKGEKSLLFDLTVDHKSDGGGEKGHYPIGWPRMTIPFSGKGTDLTKYDYLTLWVMVDSERDEIADDFSPLYIAFRSKLKKKTLYMKTILNDTEQRVWKPVILPVKEMIGEQANEKTWSLITSIAVGICESKYKHGENVRFYLDGISLVKFKSPVISSLEAPRNLTLPCQNIVCVSEVMGVSDSSKETYKMKAQLCDEKGNIILQKNCPLAKNVRLCFDASKLMPGNYILKVLLIDSKGKECSSKSTRLRAVPGPFYK